MGSIQKIYCDTCGIETIQGNYLSITEEFSSPVFVLKMNICPICYSKLLTFFQNTKANIDAAWKLPEVNSTELNTGIIL